MRGIMKSLFVAVKIMKNKCLVIPIWLTPVKQKNENCVTINNCNSGTLFQVFQVMLLILFTRNINFMLKLFPFITSATDGGRRLCFHLCLSVYPWARYLKTLWTNSDETWWAGWVCDKDELFQFWWRSESRSGYANQSIFFFLAASRVANAGSKRAPRCSCSSSSGEDKTFRTWDAARGSFIYRIRISLNTKHLYTSSHWRCLLRASIMNF